MSVRHTVMLQLMDAIQSAFIGPLYYTQLPAELIPTGLFALLEDRDAEHIETTMSPSGWICRQTYQLSLCYRTTDFADACQQLDIACDQIYDTLMSHAGLLGAALSVGTEPFTLAVDYSFGTEPVIALSGAVILEYQTTRSSG